MTIEEKIKQYKLLKRSKRTLDQRLAELREDIISWFHETCAGHESGLEIRERDLTSLDEDKVHQLMDSRGIARHEYCIWKPYASLIEQLYLDERLTDSDLREIRDPKYSYALIEVGEDVQEIDDSKRTGIRT